MPEPEKPYRVALKGSGAVEQVAKLSRSAIEREGQREMSDHAGRINCSGCSWRWFGMRAERTNGELRYSGPSGPERDSDSADQDVNARHAGRRSASQSTRDTRL